MVLTTELKLSGNDALPIKTFQSFEVDPLAAITATLAKFQDDEEAWIQLLLRPAPSNWHKRSERYIAGMQGKGKTSTGSLLTAFWSAPAVQEQVEAAKLTDYEQTRVGAAEEKSQKLAFESSCYVLSTAVMFPSRRPSYACSLLSLVTSSSTQRTLMALS